LRLIGRAWQQRRRHAVADEAVADDLDPVLQPTDRRRVIIQPPMGGCPAISMLAVEQSGRVPDRRQVSRPWLRTALAGCQGQEVPDRGAAVLGE
jgi:hypothetical protein